MSYIYAYIYDTKELWHGDRFEDLASKDQSLVIEQGLFQHFCGETGAEIH